MASKNKTLEENLQGLLAEFEKLLEVYGAFKVTVGHDNRMIVVARVKGEKEHEFFISKHVLGQRALRGRVRDGKTL